MDAERSGHSMTDRRLDREVRALLAADPSREFAARVRERIAEQPQPSGWWMSWRVAVAGAAVAAIAMAAVGRRPAPTPATSSSLPAKRQADTGIGLPALDQRVLPVDLASRRRVAGAARVVAWRRVTVVAAHEPQPDVLVDRREAVAIRAFIQHAQMGRVELTAIVDTARPLQPDGGQVPEILFAPIPLEPLAGGVDDKGVRP